MAGLNIPMRTTANVTTTEGHILYPKIVRSTTTQEKLANIFTVATKKHHALYDFKPLTLSDEDKLDDTNSLEMLIKQTYHRNFEFEMHDVLQNILIVDPNDLKERDIIQVNNLYKDYKNISTDEVHASNCWNRRWALSTESFEENLILTQKFLVNHCSQGLYEQVLTEYDDDAIEDEERGGPLFFILMINELLTWTPCLAFLNRWPPRRTCT
jgi:hypothetical protein